MSEDQPKKPTPEPTPPAAGSAADTPPEPVAEAPAQETTEAAAPATEVREETVPLAAAKKVAAEEAGGAEPAVKEATAEKEAKAATAKKGAAEEAGGAEPAAKEATAEKEAKAAAAKKVTAEEAGGAEPAAKKATAEKKAKAAAAKKAKADSEGDEGGDGKEKKKKGLPAKEYVLVGATSPHVLNQETIPRIMFTVCLTLLPAILVGVYAFGLQAVKVLLLTAGTCVATEAGLQKWMGRKVTINDGSAAVTGLLLAMTLPPSAPWWICVVGGMIAIGIGKQIFGGLAHNPFNPALLSRVVLLISWPVQLTTWLKPGESFANLGADVVTGASQLGQMKEGLIQQGSIQAAMQQFNAWDAFLGIHQYGSLAETSALALVIGGIYLLYRGYITWHIPVGYMGTVALIAAVFWLYDPNRFASPLYHMLTGGLILGAIYMATDMVTCPVTNLGMLYFGIGCGVLTYFIRTFGGYPEGVSFAIVIMNGTVPLIERWVRPRTYGTKLPSTA
jgi:electron transport complex protein RnfD